MATTKKNKKQPVRNPGLLKKLFGKSNRPRYQDAVVIKVDDGEIVIVGEVEPEHLKVIKGLLSDPESTVTFISNSGKEFKINRIRKERTVRAYDRDREMMRVLGRDRINR